MKKKFIYAFFDVEMNMWTDPQVLRNDVEAKKLYTHLMKNDYFNGCPVEMYCIGEYRLESKDTPIGLLPFRKIYLNDTVDDGDVENE